MCRNLRLTRMSQVARNPCVAACPLSVCRDSVVYRVTQICIYPCIATRPSPVCRKAPLTHAALVAHYLCVANHLFNHVSQLATRLCVVRRNSSLAPYARDRKRE